jgi:hypothetical protein
MTNTQKLLDSLSSIKNDANRSDEVPTTRFDRPTRPPVSNERGEDENGNTIYIDRIYGNLNGDTRLVQKDGSEYKGKIHKRRKSVRVKDGENFYTTVYETSDGRWFDNGGMPIEAPSKIIKEIEQPDQESNTET